MEIPDGNFPTMKATPRAPHGVGIGAPCPSSATRELTHKARPRGGSVGGGSLPGSDVGRKLYIYPLPKDNKPQEKITI